jgi:hypothetical protein
MDTQKMISVIETYRVQLAAAGVPKEQLAKDRCFGDASPDELLAHAHFLCDGAKEYAAKPAQYGKANRHLTSIQMCLSFARWYTLGELMAHNAPQPEPPAKQNFTPGVTNFREPAGMT